MLTSAAPEEQDKRYRVLVVLQRTDRPRYYDFYCPMCQMKVCELSGTEVIAMQDVMDTSNTPLVGVRCDGRYQGGYCRIYYYFTLSEKPPRVPPPIVVSAPSAGILISVVSPNT